VELGSGQGGGKAREAVSMMTPDHVRAIALALPETVESAHMGHPDFRVGGRIFATLTPERGLAMAKLTLEQQELLCAAEPSIFVPVPGGWGKRGSTHIRLEKADEATLASALLMAFRNVAPKRLAVCLDGGALRQGPVREAARKALAASSPSSRIRLRKARRAEAEAISRMILRAVEVSNARDYQPAVIAALTAKHSAPEVLRRMRERLVFVAMIDGELAGTVSLAAERVHSVFVDPSRQGRGVGAAMMAFIEKLAHRQGRERLSLASSLTAVNFYRKLGYEGSQREVRPGGIETVLMSKALLG
jgi:GNAT superfamily N-acetyltransferase